MGGVIGWKICGVEWLYWWFKWLLILVFDRILWVVFIGLKLWFFKLNRGRLRFFDKFLVDFVCIVFWFGSGGSGGGGCEWVGVVYVLIVLLLKEGEDTFLVKVSGVGGLRIFVIKDVVVIGGGVLSGCLNLLRFRLVIFMGIERGNINSGFVVKR